MYKPISSLSQLAKQVQLTVLTQLKYYCKYYISNIIINMSVAGIKPIQSQFKQQICCRKKNCQKKNNQSLNLKVRRNKNVNLKESCKTVA